MTRIKAIKKYLTASLTIVFVIFSALPAIAEHDELEIGQAIPGIDTVEACVEQYGKTWGRVGGCYGRAGCAIEEYNDFDPGTENKKCIYFGPARLFNPWHWDATPVAIKEGDEFRYTQEQCEAAGGSWLDYDGENVFYASRIAENSFCDFPNGVWCWDNVRDDARFEQIYDYGDTGGTWTYLMTSSNRTVWDAPYYWTPNLNSKMLCSAEARLRSAASLDAKEDVRGNVIGVLVEFEYLPADEVQADLDISVDFGGRFPEDVGSNYQCGRDAGGAGGANRCYFRIRVPEDAVKVEATIKGYKDFKGISTTGEAIIPQDENGEYLVWPHHGAIPSYSTIDPHTSCPFEEHTVYKEEDDTCVSADFDFNRDGLVNGADTVFFIRLVKVISEGNGHEGHRSELYRVLGEEESLEWIETVSQGRGYDIVEDGVIDIKDGQFFRFAVGADRIDIHQHPNQSARRAPWTVFSDNGIVLTDELDSEREITQFADHIRALYSTRTGYEH